MSRVSVSFTEDHYYGKDEWPNTELANNSFSINSEVNICFISSPIQEYCIEKH